MKYTKWLVAMAGAAMLTSCVDDFDTNSYVVNKPGSSEDYEYLNEYEPLKNYLDRSAHPNFKVSGALTASEFNNKGNVYTLARANFDEIVAGNAMKMSSVVNDKGEFNWSTVQSFVSAAEDAGLTIYGHTLAWHSQQPVKWLSKLIADKPKPSDPGSGSKPAFSYIVNRDFEDAGQIIGGWGNGSSQAVEDGVLVLTNPSVANFWEAQIAIDQDTPFESGKTYTLLMKVKSDAEGLLRVGFQNPENYAGCGDFTPTQLSSSWQDVALSCTVNGDNAKRFIFSYGDVAGKIYIDDLKLFAGNVGDDAPAAPAKETLIERNFSDASQVIGGWGNGSSQAVEDGVLVLTNPSAANFWEAQIAIDQNTAFENGKAYYLKMKVKSDAEGLLRVGFQNPENYAGCGDFNPITLSADWQDVDLTCTVNGDNAKRFIFSYGDVAGKIYIDDLTLMTDGTASSGGNSGSGSGSDAVEYKEVWTNQISNSEMLEGKTMENFVARDQVKSDTPADVVVGGGPNGMNSIKIVGKTSTKNSWDTQFFVYTPNKKWEAGEKYKFHMWYKASKSIGTDTQVHAGPGEYKHWQMLSPNPTFTTDWQEGTWEGTIPSEGAGAQQSIAFNLNKNRTAAEDAEETVEQITYEFAGITWESCQLVEVPKVEVVVTEYVTNSDMEGTEAANFVRKENNGALETVITSGVGVGGSRGVQVTSNAGAEQDWDTQFWIKLNEPLAENETVNVQFDYKASASATADTQAHGEPGDYAHWQCIGSPNFTTEWQTYTQVLKVDGSMASKGGLKSIAFNLSKDRGQQVTYYFDNIRVWKEEEHEIKNTIPLTPEEKKDTLMYAMKLWVDGMMKATEGKVKSWDLINEAISGGGNVNGYYDLQHFEGYQAGGTWDVGGDAFYWQDYFGAEEYGVIMEKLAREAYAAQEDVNPADLKLFINDYNLESTWDDNKKLESLIYWIGVWESQGAKIDGIGTQMHISYIRDAAQQENQKKHITRMFELMAQTGKLVRISELDMGLCDKQFGEAVKTSDMTFADEKAMADYYQWIIEEYFRIVPPAQQYGICQWCLTDAPESSGWRGGEPVGLWYLDYSRKPAYGGWAEGLKK